MSSSKKRYLLSIFIAMAFWSCNEAMEENPEPDLIKAPRELMAEVNENFAGGSETVFDASVNAFGFQSPSLSGNDGLLFFVGNSLFNKNWVTAPASTTARDGLGPFFNARSCSSCHSRDGRGMQNVGDQIGRGILLRLSTPGFDFHGGPKPDPIYGKQLQDQSILSVKSQGSFNVNYEELTGQYADGQAYTLRKPSYTIKDLFYGSLDQGVLISPRVGQQIIGLGLLEAIDVQTILSFADDRDTNMDGISGKANYVWNVLENRKSLGRFGWKANEPDILQQTAGASAGDLGITNYLFPEENCITGLDCSEIPNGGLEEIDEDDLKKVALYIATLAVPARRDWNEREVLVGKYYFNEMRCNSCHIPKMVTGTHERFPFLSDQVIRPYTDLLLHDMGDGLADNRPDFMATGNEWRTQPLWGIGLIETVNGHTFYLHDGRARNLEEAILWHGGEAEASKEQFKKLEKSDREAVIKFLNSL